jgi:hypothetical protein
MVPWGTEFEGNISRNESSSFSLALDVLLSALLTLTLTMPWAKHHLKARKLKPKLNRAGRGIA